MLIVTPQVVDQYEADISQIAFKSTPTVPNFHRHWNSFTSAAV